MSDSRSILRSRENQSIAKKIYRLLLDSGTQAVLIHRAAHFFSVSRIPCIPAIIRRINIFLTGADIHPKASFQKEVSFIHSVGTVIGEGVLIKSGCEIFGGVTLGGRGGSREDDGNPVIDHNCVICSGAVIIGNITIGKNVTVAAGSVVLDSVPDNVMVAGNPAVIKVQYAH